MGRLGGLVWLQAGLTRTMNVLGRKSKALKEGEANLAGDHIREGLTCVFAVKVRLDGLHPFPAGLLAAAGRSQRLLHPTLAGQGQRTRRRQAAHMHVTPLCTCHGIESLHTFRQRPCDLVPCKPQCLSHVPGQVLVGAGWAYE